MRRTATTEQVAEALHVGPAAVRKYARGNRIPFDTTPGGHRRYNVNEVVAALTSAAAQQPEAPTPDEVYEYADEPYVYIEPSHTVTITCPVIVGDAQPVGAYDTVDEQAIWGQETPVV